MKLISLFVFVCFITNFVFAQDYLITFSGTGESNTVSSVLVENLTQAKSLTLNGNDVLNLKKVATAVSDIEKPVIQNIRIYPNPLKGFSLLTFTLSKEGETFIELFDVAGRVLLKTNDYLPAGLHDYRLSGTGTGIYLIRVTSGNQFLTGKLISDNPLTGKPELTLHSSIPANKNKTALKNASSGIKEMQYNSGDRLKFTGISGKFKTVVVDIPEGNKTIGFTFYTCTDNDGKDYAIVGAGAQWWMAENLAYLPAVYPPETGSETLPHSYVYGYNGTSKTEAKATQNFLTYGVLYNWPAAMNGAASSNANPSGVRGLCPAGWHLPSEAELLALEAFLGESAAGGKMKETGTTHWQNPNTGATNESGFSALPGGYRTNNGSFTDNSLLSIWWSTSAPTNTEASVWHLGNARQILGIWYYNRQGGLNVRCVKDLLPVITTTTITQITQTAATGGGNVTSDGGGAVTARGVCWSTSQNPTTAGSKTTDGSVTGTFTSSITGLTPNTTYYVRAFATNTAGTAYGSQESFATLPSVTSGPVAGITQTTATCGGNVEVGGGAALSARGVCWGTSQYPTPADSKTTDGTGTGSFTSSITGLSAGTLYYVRAYATNSGGTGYGLDFTFTTLSNVTTNPVSAVTQTTATSGGIVDIGGGAAISDRGVCWSTNQNPTTANSKTTDGFGTGTFTSSMTGLTAGTTYYVRAYATNIQGTSYGNQITFTTSGLTITLPTLSTNPITAITQTTATCGGIINSDGGAAVTARGVCWSTSQNPTTANSKTTDGSGTGTFTSNLTGLTASTPYYVRAYATNSAGTAYGSQEMFTTSGPTITPPSVTTNPVTAITQTTATGGGIVNSDGGAAVTARGVCWSTTQNPTTANSKTSDGTGAGTFTSNLAGLTANTPYYVRAYATNSAGTTYGNQEMFTTSGPTITPPTVTTAVITAIGETIATGGGNVTSDGGGTVTARGVCWSTSQNPTIANSKTTDGTGTGTFTSNLTGLTANTPYYVRAYATNSAGTVYGSQITLTTLPNVTTWDIYPIYNHYALGGGNIPVDGGAAITARGVCWSTNPNPTTADSKTDGTGAGSFLNTLTQLTANTFYYTRAYATNAGGTSYGSQLTFTTLPNVTTSPVTGITQTTATGGGNVEVGGGAAITTRGVCWSTSQNPTTANNKTTDGTSAGSFTSSITGLTAGTLYYVRAYATNGGGTAYGEQVQFHAKNQTGTFQDPRDNTVYDWVKIGAQTWMAENLAYLPSVSPPSAGSETSPFFYVYGYDGANVSAARATSNYSTYGALYNWPAALTACPAGWHLPSDEEWTSLSNYMIANGYNYDGTTTGDKIAKSLAAITNWAAGTATGTIGCDLPANNASGFSALPGGNRNYNGTFGFVGGYGGWWSSNEKYSLAVLRAFFSDDYSLGDNGSINKVIGISVRCLRDILPTITTNPITGITQTAATSGGNVTSQGETPVTAWGVCWSTSQNPTTANSKTTDGSGSGTFTSNITGLTAGTLYYVRAYATNADGTAYGSQESFRTKNLTGTFTDSRDSKAYNWVQIGAQVWMAQNLAYLPKVSPPGGGSDVDKVYYVYGYSGIDPLMAKLQPEYKTYGTLYNWPAALTACPAGWHLPGDAEWTTLGNYLIANGYNYDGTTTGNKIAKSMAATANWTTSTNPGAIGNNLTINNSSGFSALPGGYRSDNGVFNSLGNGGNWWTASENNTASAWNRNLGYSTTSLYGNDIAKTYGISVRCVRD